MKKILFIVLLLSVTLQSNASHIFGGQMTYQCLGNDQYLVQYVFYRDCYGYAQQYTPIIINNSCGYPGMNVLLSLDTSASFRIFPTCANQVSVCEGGTEIGIARYVYEATVTLPAPCAHWTFSLMQSSRNVWVTVTTNPGSYDFYIEASLNNDNGICNSSPVFTEEPPIVACIGQKVCMDLGLQESDGDSFTVSLIAPLISPYDSMPYDSGYSVTNPFGSQYPIDFDPNTGTLCFIAQSEEVGVIVVKISEYRNGVLVGEVERDVEQYTIACNNQVPLLSGVNGTSDYSINACAGEQLCFSIASSDPNIGDSTFIFNYSGIPGSVLTTTGGNPDSAYFCWTPSVADIDTLPHILTVNVRDNNCTYRQSTLYHYNIMVYDTATCAILSSGNTIAESGIKIFPSPAKDFLHISFDDSGVVINHPQYELKNIEGKIIQSGLLKDADNLITLNRLSQGTYVLSIHNASGKTLMMQKVIISR